MLEGGGGEAQGPSPKGAFSGLGLLHPERQGVCVWGRSYRVVQVEIIILIIICIQFISHQGEEECNYLLSGAMNQTE
jgi:hypothetical protein